MHQIIKRNVLVPLVQIRPVSAGTIGLFALIQSLYLYWMSMAFFPLNIANDIHQGSSGLLDFNLMANGLALALLWILLVVRGKLTFWEMGLKGDIRLNRAISTVLMAWMTVQLLNVMASVIAPEVPFIDSRWESFGGARVLGIFIGQLFGTALFYEVAYRGFLTSQMIKRFSKRSHPVVYGLLAAQGLMVLIHLPGALLQGRAFQEILASMVLLFLYGIMYAGVYLMTDNLYMAIGFHALINAPTVIFQGPLTHYGLVAIMLAVAGFYQYYTGQPAPLPLRVIETDRLLLRPWQMKDAKDLYEYAKSDLVGPSAGWAPHDSLKTSQEVIKNFIDSGEVYAIALRSTGKVIGSIGIHDRMPDNSDRSEGQKEIGYVLNPAYWGKGYMPETVEAIIAFCFEDLGINKLWCGHFIDNLKSKRVIEKTGFTYEFNKETALVAFHGQRVETLFYSIKKEEYKIRKNR